MTVSDLVPIVRHLDTDYADILAAEMDGISGEHCATAYAAGIVARYATAGRISQDLRRVLIAALDRCEDGHTRDMARLGLEPKRPSDVDREHDAWAEATR